MESFFNHSVRLIAAQKSLLHDSSRRFSVLAVAELDCFLDSAVEKEVGEAFKKLASISEWESTIKRGASFED